MAISRRRDRTLRGAAAWPLVAAAQQDDSGHTLEALAERLGQPVAGLRGAASFYQDLAIPADAVRVCRGTSCLLAGADELHAQLAAAVPCASAYCLGHCDHSPALLRPDGTVVAGCHERSVDDLLGAAEAPPSTSIRTLVEAPIVLERAARGDHSSLARARDAGVYEGLAAALAGPPEALLEAVTRGRLRGRGGAGFPVGSKWQACAAAPGERKFVVANGDEGDPGSFVDRVLMELDPHALLEGMVLCGYAVGAQKGVVFIRSEYPRAATVMEQAIVEARAAGLLGRDLLGSGFAFDVMVVQGLGSYVCGEETALLNAIEGHRGEVRLRPPYPAEAGLFGWPTVVNNVETLVAVPWLVRHGAEAFTARGTAASPGTKALCLNGGFARPGLLEVELGTPLRAVLDEAGGGRDGRALEAVLMGGPMGCLVGPEDWDVPLCYNAVAERGLQLGHGGLVAVLEGTDLWRLVVHWLEFMADESCGKCVPCRLGSRRALELARDPAQKSSLTPLLDVMADGSLCAFGQLIPGAVRQVLARLEKGAGR